MLFRPEEVHGASSIRESFKPFCEGYGHIAQHVLRPGVPDNAVFHLHLHRTAAIQAGGIYSYILSRVEPADRQRFKPSLAEPLLFPVHADPVLRRQAAEGRKGADVIGIREKPYAGDAKLHKVMEGFAAVLNRHPQFLCDPGVMGRNPGFDHPVQNYLVGSVEQTLGGHRDPPFIQGSMKIKFEFWSERIPRSLLRG
jgi:hypothetical protein